MLEATKRSLMSLNRFNETNNKKSITELRDFCQNLPDTVLNVTITYLSNGKPKGRLIVKKRSEELLELYLSTLEAMRDSKDISAAIMKISEPKKVFTILQEKEWMFEE